MSEPEPPHVDEHVRRKGRAARPPWLRWAYLAGGVCIMLSGVINWLDADDGLQHVGAGVQVGGGLIMLCGAAMIFRESQPPR